jgi:hypothetical protein
MSSTSETGHGVNVANYKSLILTCTYFGTTYNPVNAALKLSAMNTQAAAAEAAMNDLKIAMPVYRMAVKEREAAFDLLMPLVTRIINAYEAMGGDPSLYEMAAGIVRELRGLRATPLPEPTGPEEDDDVTEKAHSVSRKSYQSRLDNYDRLLKTLGTNGSGYNPNEATLDLAVLQAFYATLSAKHSAVDNAYQPVKLARNLRNALLYAPKTGVLAVAALVKKYVKSVYGAKSPEFKQVSGIKFTKLA